MARCTYRPIALAAWIALTAPPLPAAAEESPDESPSVDINALFDRASRRAARGDTESAIRTFKEILPHAPWWSDVAWNIGSLAEASEAWADCAFYFRRYLHLEPDDEERDALLRRVERCESRIPTLGTLEITVTDLPEAHIFINDIEMGSGALHLPLAAGPWAVRVERIDHESFATTAEVTAGETTHVTTRLEPITYFGTVLIESDPPGATVLIDGERVGVTGSLAPVRRPVGRYLVVLEAEGFHPWQRYVEVGRDRETAVDASLLSSRVRLDDF